MADLYVSDIDYSKNVDITRVVLIFSTDDATAGDDTVPGIQISSIIAAEMIKAIAQAGGLEIEIIDTKRY